MLSNVDLISISIHAPLAGSDDKSGVQITGTNDISIHAPLAGSDQLHIQMYKAYFVFQSTLPLRGATRRVPGRDAAIFISIHAPLAGSDQHGGSDLQSRTISIHAPLAGSDSKPV